MKDENIRATLDSVPPRQPANADAGQPGQSGLSGENMLAFHWFNNVAPHLDTADFVEGVLLDAAMSVTYGESNSGKTFFATDLAQRISLGWSFHGRETELGAVIYLAAEGGHGINNRIAAFRKYHDLDAAPPFAVVPGSINLKDTDGDTERVINTASMIQEQTGYPVKLVVVDTLSRVLAGGEENGSQDMGAVVGSVDRIRQETGAHVMLVHHSGKDTAKGARGHSLLRAATDTEIEIAKPEGGSVATATVRKQRDLPCEGEFPFTLEPVELGRDRRGNAVTSCVVLPAEAPEPARPKLTGQKRLAFEFLQKAIHEVGETPPASQNIPTNVRAVPLHVWREYSYKGGLSTSADQDARQKAFVRASQGLQNAGLVRVWNDWTWIVE